MSKTLLAALLLGLSLSLHAASTLEQFHFDKQQQTDDFRELLGQMRCLVCQNESLAASNADLAQDLREELYEQVASGKNKQDVIDFMVARYGDFVLYKPPLRPSTYLIWFGPILLLLIGAVILYRILRKQTSMKASTLTEAEKQRAEALLKSTESGTPAS